MARESAAEEPRLQPIELLAVHCLGKKADDVREDVDVGDGQPVDFTVRIFGAVNVGDEGKQTVTEKPSLVDVLAVCMKKFGADEVERLMRGAYQKAVDGKAKIDENLRKAAAQLVSDLTRSKKVPTRGRVTSALNYDVLGQR